VLNEQAGFAWEALSPALCMLRISGCEMTAALMQSLAQLQSLTSLSFVNCSFVGSRISELGAALRKLTSLQELELEGSGTQLGIDAVKQQHQLKYAEDSQTQLPRLAPAATAFAKLLASFVHLNSREQLRSLRLALTMLPSARALNYVAGSTAEQQSQKWVPWAARVAAAPNNWVRLALEEDVLDGVDDALFANMVPMIIKVQVGTSSGYHDRRIVSDGYSIMDDPSHDVEWHWLVTTGVCMSQP
jgi:hypothetical protein